MNSTAEERKRKMLLFLPLLILPFLALGFYALGGGKESGDLSAAGTGKGINTELPGAKLTPDQEDKYSLYEKAKRDSAAAQGKSAAGAFASLGWDTAAFRWEQAKRSADPGYGSVAGPASGSATDNEAKIAAKVAEINKQINAPPPVAPVPVANPATAASTAELEKVEKLLKEKQEAGTPDPQLQQLNGMLDKLMLIQNPALAKDKQAAGGKAVAPDSAFRAIPAVIDGNQKVLQGGLVRLRLKDTVTLGGITYPKGQALSGLCVITNQRLLLDIKNIRLGSSIIPVSLTVFSLDGMPGIDAPEAELGEAAGNGSANALDNMELMGMDQSLGAQAATAGISAAKSLIGKKVRRVKVKLKGGQALLLRNNQSGRR